jgi:hypothetical protein
MRAKKRMMPLGRGTRVVLLDISSPQLNGFLRAQQNACAIGYAILRFLKDGNAVSSHIMHAVVTVNLSA